MANIIKIKRSTNAGVVPTLQDGELAINQADMKLFIKNAAGTVKSIDFTSDAEKVTSGPIKQALDSALATINNKADLALATFTGKVTIAQTTGAMGRTAGGLAKLQVVGNGGAGDAAFMEFHRPNSFAGYLGLDTDNQWKVGGWSAGDVSYKIWHEGTFTPASKADVTGQIFSGDLGVVRAGDSGLYLQDTSAPATSFRQKALISSKNADGGDTLLFRFTRPSDGALRDFRLGGTGGVIFHTGNFDPNTKQDANTTINQDARVNEQRPWSTIQRTGGQYVYQYATPNDLGIYDTVDGRIWNYNKPSKTFNIVPTVTMNQNLTVGGYIISSYKKVTNGGDAIFELETTGAAANTFRKKQIYSSANVGGGSNWLFRSIRPSDNAIEDFTLQTGTGGNILTTNSSSLSVSFQDIYATRSNGPTGVIYFGNQGTNGGRYLFYDGGNYVLQGAEAYIAGSRAWRDSGAGGYNISKQVDAGSNNPYLNWYTVEPGGKGVNADTFYIPYVYIHETSSQVGHREQIHTEIRSNNGPPSKFIVGANIGATVVSGQGNAFALNGVTIIEGGLGGNIEASVSELNMVCKSNVIRKTILQLVDVAGSGGAGSAVDAALLIAKQYGAFGNGNAIEIGSLNDANQWPCRSRILHCNPGTSEVGFDIRSAFFTSYQAILLSPGHRITWAAGGGGSIRSDSATNGMQQIFYNDGVSWQTNSGGPGFNYYLSRAALCPGTDAGASLGQPDFRWNTVFAATGGIQTSDEKFKTDIQDPDDELLDAIGDVEVKIFKYLSSVEEKGEEKARRHAGVIAQQVEEAFINRGIDPTHYAFWCEDPLMEDVEETTEEEQEDYKEVEYEERETVFEDDKAVLRTVKKTRREPILDQYPVFNEDGTPHMTASRPAQMAKDENGKEVEISGETESTQMFVSKPRMKTVKVTKTVKKQKVDENGKLMTQLGIRYTDLAILLHAWTRRELRKR